MEKKLNKLGKLSLVKSTRAVMPKYLRRMSGSNKIYSDQMGARINYDKFFSKFADFEYTDMTRAALQHMTTPMDSLEDDEEELPKGIYVRFSIDNESAYKRSWDALICVGALFEGVLVPLELSFSVAVEGSTRVIRGLFDMFFFFDIVFGFLTSYTDSMGLVQRDVRSTSRHYATSWFPLDFVAGFPFFIFLASSSFGGGLPSAIELLRALRLVKVVRKTKQVFYKLNVFQSIVQLMLVIFMMIHWIAAIMVQVVGMSSASMWEQNQFAVDFEWGTIGKYSTYVYAVVEILLGQSRPTTIEERWFAAAFQVIGLVVQAIVLGEVSLLIQKLRAKATKWKYKMDLVNESMNYMNLPRDLRARVRNYFAYSWAVYGGDDGGNMWLQELSESLHSEVKLKLNRSMIEQVPLFSEAQDNFVRAVVMSLRPQLYLPGDYVIRYGMIGKEMYFTVKGTLHALDKDENVVFSVLQPGSFFGEIALTKQDAKRTAAVRAISYAEVNVLTQEDFQSLLLQYPDDAKEILRSGEQREANTEKIQALYNKKQRSTLHSTDDTPLHLGAKPLKKLLQRSWDATSSRNTSTNDDLELTDISRLSKSDKADQNGPRLRE